MSTVPTTGPCRCRVFEWRCCVSALLFSPSTLGRMTRIAPLLTLLSACEPASTDEASLRLEELGQALFSDENLSLGRTQSCATCHNPEHAFVDDRKGEDGLIAATSR